MTFAILWLTGRKKHTDSHHILHVMIRSLRAITVLAFCSCDQIPEKNQLIRKKGEFCLPLSEVGFSLQFVSYPDFRGFVELVHDREDPLEKSGSAQKSWRNKRERQSPQGLYVPFSNMTPENPSTSFYYVPLSIGSTTCQKCHRMTAKQ